MTSKVWRAAAVSVAPVLHTDTDLPQLHEILGRRPIMRQRQGVAIRVVEKALRDQMTGWV